MAGLNDVLTPHERRTNLYINRGFTVGGLSGLVLGAVVTGILSKQVFPTFLLGVCGAALGMFTGAGIGACVGNYQNRVNPLDDGDDLPANRVLLLTRLSIVNGAQAPALPVAEVFVQPTAAEAGTQTANTTPSPRGVTEV
ncbi:MAG: hypothetical protein P1U40_03500 [Coxiellaceae bacterium]|nr:hypothetical protein [Coxiellaceae bacterium]